MIIIDARCGCARCEARTQNIYRIIGHCQNCMTTNILLLYRAGDPIALQSCPVCGLNYVVASDRPATPDEIPAAVLTDAPDGGPR